MSRPAVTAQAPPRTFYSAAEVAESIGLTYQQVLALTKNGEIPFRRFGRYVRIPATWVREQLGETDRAGSV